MKQYVTQTEKDGSWTDRCVYHDMAEAVDAMKALERDEPESEHCVKMEVS